MFQKWLEWLGVSANCFGLACSTLDPFNESCNLFMRSCCIFISWLGLLRIVAIPKLKVYDVKFCWPLKASYIAVVVDSIFQIREAG